MPPVTICKFGGSAAVALMALLATVLAQGADPPNPHTLPPPVEMTAQQDHQHMMDLLHISSLRPGSGRQQSPGAQCRQYR